VRRIERPGTIHAREHAVHGAAVAAAGVGLASRVIGYDDGRAALPAEVATEQLGQVDPHGLCLSICQSGAGATNPGWPEMRQSNKRHPGDYTLNSLKNYRRCEVI
jgi:hypothetical protein